jgi:hypothetical protein
LHCFNSFFAYTFFKWKPPHSLSHGICIANIGDDIGAIKITIMKNGMFQRLIDTWSCLGASVAFSEYFPIFEGKDIDFETNRLPLQESKCFDLANLLAFDPYEYERKYWKEFGRANLIHNSSLRNSMGTPSEIMKSYIILFAASSIARYRPILWSSILSGESEDKAVFALEIEMLC